MEENQAPERTDSESMAARNGQRPSWRVRRRIITATLLFCALEVGYLTLYGKDTKLHEAIVTGAFLLAGSVIGSYVFGAVWDDKKNNREARDSRRYRDRDDY